MIKNIILLGVFIFLSSFFLINRTGSLDKEPIILKIESHFTDKKKISYDTLFKRVLKKEKFRLITEQEGLNLFQIEYERQMSKYKDKNGFVAQGNQETMILAMMKTPSVAREVKLNIYYSSLVIDSINIEAKNYCNGESKKPYKSTFKNSGSIENPIFIKNMLDSCFSSKCFFVER